jgi:hypothetical protein
MASNGVASMRFFFVSPLTARRSPKMRMHYTYRVGLCAAPVE